MSDSPYRIVGREFTDLSSSIDNSQTTIDVTDGTIFLSDGIQPILIDAEIMWVIGVSVNTLTVERGKEGTAPASHSMNAQVIPILTKALFDGYNGESSGNVECRLTVLQGNPLPTAPASGTTIYLEPFNGNRLSLMDTVESQWRSFTLHSGIPCDVVATPSGACDVFAYYNPTSNNIELENVAWANRNTRATTLSLNDGVWSKTGETHKRYVGSYYTEEGEAVYDDYSRRHLFNVNNRVERPLLVNIGDNSWTISATVGPRDINNIERSVSIFCGLSGVPYLDLEASLTVYSSDLSTSVKYILGLTTQSGIFDSEINRTSICRPYFSYQEARAVRKECVNTVGYNKYRLQEYWSGGGDIGVYGDNDEEVRLRSAIEGMVKL